MFTLSKASKWERTTQLLGHLRFSDRAILSIFIPYALMKLLYKFRLIRSPCSRNHGDHPSPSATPLSHASQSHSHIVDDTFPIYCIVYLYDIFITLCRFITHVITTSMGYIDWFWFGWLLFMEDVVTVVWWHINQRTYSGDLAEYNIIEILHLSNRLSSKSWLLKAQLLIPLSV